MFVDVIADVISWAFGSIENLGLVLVMIFLGRELRGGAAIGAWLSMAGWGAIGLGVLILVGAVDIHPGALFGMLQTAFNAVMGVV